MELGLAGRTALITGASRGIGRACALALAGEGARVAVCARTSAALDEMVAAMGGAAAGHAALGVDLMADDGPARLAAWLAEHVGHVDIVVHNLGGTLGVRGALVPIADWRRVMRLNFEVAAELNASLIPPMCERQDGRIIFISSLAAFEHQGASMPYAVAKAALTAYVRALGRTYARDGVVVSGIVPGVVLSEGGVWAERMERDPNGVQRYIEEHIPRGRLGAPEEVASAVTFLASRHGAPFAGSIVPLEGGQARSFFGQ